MKNLTGMSVPLDLPAYGRPSLDPSKNRLTACSDGSIPSPFADYLQPSVSVLRNNVEKEKRYEALPDCSPHHPLLHFVLPRGTRCTSQRPLTGCYRRRKKGGQVSFVYLVDRPRD